MSVLFVDVVGTLLDRMDDPVTAVVEAVREQHARHPERPIVVWTGMGARHAGLVIGRLFPDSGFVGMDKGVDLGKKLHEGDVVVDDDENVRYLAKLAVPTLVVLTPEEFVDWAYGGDAWFRARV